jgi:hypothetical protein
MKTLLLSFFVLAGSVVNAQSHTFGTFSFNFDYDIGGHAVEFEQTYDDGTNSITANKDTSGAVTSLFRFDGHFNVLRFLSVGLHMRNGSYIEDPENTQNKGNKVSVVGLGLRGYLVNKDKVAWYAETTFGGSNLTMNKELTFIITIPYQYKFRGSHFGVGTGLNWYFANNLGMNFEFGYTTQKYTMTDYTLNGEKQDLTNWDNRLTSAGVHFNLGFVFHVGGK